MPLELSIHTTIPAWRTDCLGYGSRGKTRANLIWRIQDRMITWPWWLRSWEHATSATALTDSRMPAVMALDSNVHVLIGSSPACSVTRKQSYLQDPHSGRSQVSQLHILSCKMTKHTWNTQSEPFTHPHPSLLTNTIQQ